MCCELATATKMQRCDTRKIDLQTCLAAKTWGGK